MAQKSNAGADRQAKIQAASKASGGGANKIVIAAVVAVLAIVAVVGGVVWSQVSATKEAKGDGNATPAGATMGTAYPAFADATPKAGAPTVEVFEDFQCPACQQAEGILGSTLAELAQAGDIKLQYHVLNFLDRKLGNDGSVLAANGAFCAAEDGKFQEFHDAAYLNQPTEGSGWTVAGLKKLAEGAGLSGAALDTWQTCVEVGKYTNYVNAVDKNAFGTEGIQGTPTYKINGELVDIKTIATPDLLKAAVAKATK
ncbi:MAG: DsbA family protein [Actinobacteria bacterium]|jgi:Protein-disulfide isomerase|nr:DsbA family protein [Actinomycetota bacterium]